MISGAKILFCVRAAIDYERYMMIAPKLRGAADLEWLHFSSETYESFWNHPNSEVHRIRENTIFAGSWSRGELKSWIHRAAPSLIVLDQFGPSASHLYRALPQIARQCGTLSCMIPHGIPTIFDPPYCGTKQPEQIADIIFFANKLHYQHALSYYEFPGLLAKVLGDPRFDVTNLSSVHNAKSSSHSRLRLGFFESNLPAALGQNTSNLQSDFIRDIMKIDQFELKLRKHPRLDQSKDQISLSELVSWSNVVSAISSSTVFCGLYNSKPAYVLDVQEYTHGVCFSLFDSFPHRKLRVDNGLPILRVENEEATFRDLCWGGKASGKVAEEYASAFLQIVNSDFSSLDKL